MCKKFKYCLRNLVLFVFKMFKLILGRPLSVRLCQLLWCASVILFLLIVWMSSDVYKTRERHKSDYPVILWWTKDFSTSETIQCSNGHKCSVFNNKEIDEIYEVGAYLFYASNIDFKDLPLPRRPQEKVWGLFHEESPRNVEELLHEPALKLFNFSSTFSRFSNVPFPLQHLHAFEDITSKKYFVNTSTKNSYLKNISAVMYLQTDCETSTERDAYVKELMKFLKIDSFGACLKNKDLPSKFKEDYLNNLDEDEFLRFTARYKFVIAIENGVCNEYITEKYWRAIKVGSVPIYFGSPSIRDWLPNEKSAILIEDFPTPKSLYDHLKVLMENDDLYEEYLEHKTKRMISNERLIIEYEDRPYQIDGMKTVREFECFICTKLHDIMGGSTEVSVVNKSHYNCPKPISALTQTVNRFNSWVSSWESAGKDAKYLYQTVMNGD